MNRQHPGERAEGMADTVIEQARRYGEKAQDAPRHVKPFAEKSLREQPMATLAGAATIGFLLGVLWKKSGRTIFELLASKRGVVRSIWLTVWVAAGCSWTATAAQEKVEVGLLACTLSEHTDGEIGGATGTPVRNAFCAFRVRNGAQETYVGKVQVLNLSAKEKVTLVWRAKVPPTTPAVLGFLEQSYAADPRTPANQIPDLVGQANSRIILQSMADKKEGSAAARERSPTDGVVVVRVELKLKSTTI